jgi:hypothetical protein
VDQEFLAFEFIHDREKSSCDANQPSIFGVEFAFSRKKHSEAGEKENSAKKINDGMKSPEERDACENENGSQDESAGYAVVEDAMLRGGRDFEGSKNQEEDEDIVDAQRFFHQVGGEEFRAGLGAAVEVNPKIEKQGDANPCGAFDEGFFQTDGMWTAMEDAEVETECDDYCCAENYPDV